jgi:hypothetical protein
MPTLHPNMMPYLWIDQKIEGSTTTAAFQSSSVHLPQPTFMVTF